MCGWLAQDIERHRTLVEQCIVKGAYVKVWTERRLCLGPKLKNPKLSDLVRQGLRGPGYVALGFGHHHPLGQDRVVAQALRGVLGRPAHPVDADVHLQPARTPHRKRQAAEALVGRAIHAHLLAQEFRVQRPALDERRHIVAAAKMRQIRALLTERDLQVMPRHALVQDPRRQAYQRVAVGEPAHDDQARHAFGRVAEVVAARGRVKLRRLDPDPQVRRGRVANQRGSSASIRLPISAAFSR